MLMIYHCLHCYFFWSGHQWEVYEINVVAIFQIRKLRRLREDRVLAPKSQPVAVRSPEVEPVALGMLLSTLRLHLQRQPNTASASPRRHTLARAHRSPQNKDYSFHLLVIEGTFSCYQPETCHCRLRSVLSESSIFLVGIVFLMHMAY